VNSPKKSKSTASDAQLERFKPTARELGADESARAIEDKQKRIAKAKPKPDAKAPARKKR
jgi:hypothetical protein